MISKISICAENNDFKYNKLLDIDITRKHPGTSWVPLLFEQLKDKFEIVTSDIALKNVQEGKWDAADICVVQHQDHFENELLIKLGAFPCLILSMESPVYSPIFLKNGKSIGDKYLNRIMLSGLFDYFQFTSGNNYKLTFPSFFLKEVSALENLENRGFMTVVLKNMYTNYFSILYLYNLKDIIKLLTRLVLNLKSFLYKTNNFEFKQLHDARLKTIIFFLEKKCITIYGKGWDNLQNLPKYYIDKLKPFFNQSPPKTCINKISTISKYKFCLCFENATYQGGISEKIIDCFVAGVVPVYLGATDIDNFIPKNTFIDVRDFSNENELYNKIKNITDKEIEELINSGRKFLFSSEGIAFSYEGFSTFVSNCILKTLVDHNLFDLNK
jgi:hypothetical protein